ncbi:MAG: zinc carboxypeptidase [Planctomycetes bacterium]|nr:zinc carboxypeptidase [Planctomycetota bacterium]
MKTTLIVCLVCVTSTLRAETEFADISVTADFAGGSANVKSIDRNSGIIHFTPRVRSERGWPCWWYLKVDGAKVDQTITLKLTANRKPYRPGRILSADWSQPHRAAISIDNVVWTQTTKCQKQAGVATYVIKAPAESFWLAWGPPFLPSHADEVLESIKAKLPRATMFELAKTRGGRSVRGIRVGGNADKDPPEYGVWVQARQHAWEAGSSWVGRGFVEWLASDDQAAINLRRIATVYYVPIMDVDNAAMGAGGKDAVPRDHNRDWDDKPHYPEVTAAQKRILQLNADGRFDVFIDLHNPGGNERRPYFFGPINLNKLPAVQQQNHARWLAISKGAISGPLPLEPRYKFATYVKTEEERNRMSANWVRNHTADHVLSTTLETVWNTPHSTQQGYLTVGAQLGRAVSRFLESNPRGPANRCRRVHDDT